MDMMDDAPAPVGLPPPGRKNRLPRLAWHLAICLSLLFLPVYTLPWVWVPHTRQDLVIGGIGILTISALFLRGVWEAMTTRSFTPCLYGCAVLLAAFVISPFHGRWEIFIVYACALAGLARPVMLAAVTIISFLLLIIGFVWVTHEFWPNWLPTTIMGLCVGTWCICTAMLQDKNRSLLAAQDEVRLLSRTAERERIARDIHDLLGRTLTLVALKADLAARLAPHDDARATEEVRNIAAIARQGLTELRAALTGMTNATLIHELGHARAALQAAGIKCTVSGSFESVPAPCDAVLAMALREAVTNIIRHSGATASTIRLLSGRHVITLSVLDNGTGTSPHRFGRGLSGMQARLQAAGGELVIESSRQGTCLLARMREEQA
ncbi:two-component system sensor kinase [Komagataeibacter oboediens DSM 11826]|uniref:Two-component sensor histidine kinase n=2 Tax=Komagataeibacter oboediens TaxID=65958 RepID=A0A318QY23_9PROT|nr:two-component sensor histidine kinase [Komagataeibacter oboediens]GBR28757.1 two-component system sensor kinase [Komagataeibacter oboediens DSM 11826]